VTGRKLPADLAARVAGKKLTPGEAKVIAAARLKREQEERLEREREEARPEPGDAWRRHNLPEPQTRADYTAYARYILAHTPAVADSVIRDDRETEFRESVFSIHEYCPFPCDQHEPLPPDAEDAFRQRFADKPEEVEDVLGWAAHLVPEIMGWERVQPDLPLDEVTRGQQ
jgi:hypothetical protein